MIKKETVTPIDFLLVTVNFLFVVHNDILDNARENLHIRKTWNKGVKHVNRSGSHATIRDGLSRTQHNISVNINDAEHRDPGQTLYQQ